MKLKNIIICLFTIIIIYNINNGLWFLLFIAIHEGVHLLTGMILGYEFNKINILPFGLSLVFKEDSLMPRDDIIISFSGPLINFILFLVFIFLDKFGVIENKIFQNINLTLFLFNLIPSGFLDGGRILKSIFSIFFSFYIGNLLINLNGIAFGCIILVMAIIKGVSVGSFFLGALGIFFIHHSYIMFKDIKISIIKEVILKKNYYIYKKKNFVVKHRIFCSNTKLFEIIKFFCFNRYFIIYCIEQGKITNSLYEYDIINAYCSYGNITLKECIGYIVTQEE